MDYNNENNLNEENTTQENTGVDENGNYVSQFGDVTETADEFSSTDFDFENPVEEKKKFFLFKYIHPSIFIAICVFLVALIAFGAYYIFGSKTITGTWVYRVEDTSSTSTADEAQTYDYYYTFERPDGDGNGRYTVCFEGESNSGDYTVSSKDNKKVLSLGSTELYYDVEGIKLFGNATLKLTQPEQTDESTGETVEEQTIEMEQAKDPDYENQSMDDYKVDDSLVGNWDTDYKISYYYGMYQLDCNISFTDNGILKVNTKSDDLGLDSTYYYAYSAEKGKLTIKSVASDDKSEIKYTLKDGVLTFTDEKGETIFNENVLGSAQFYKHGEKPKSLETTTEATTEETTEETTQTTTAKSTEKENTSTTK
ncbi:MAG: hypothetical protein ACI4HL_03880 [Ruminococcus sp.]